MHRSTFADIPIPTIWLKIEHSTSQQSGDRLSVAKYFTAGHISRNLHFGKRCVQPAEPAEHLTDTISGSFP